MKKVATLVAWLVISGMALQAQKLDKAKDLLDKKKVAEAKTEIDNFLNIEKNKTNADAWFTKARVYLAISKDDNLKSTMPDARATSLEAIKEYLKLDEAINKEEAKKYLTSRLENNSTLVDLYTGYSRDAATFFNASNYNDAYTNFSKCLEVFDLMASRKLITIDFDTTSTLYAGVAAEKAKKTDLAAKEYANIANRKIKSEGFIDIYKWLADYYLRKGEIDNASKYNNLGKELYPEDKYWNDFAENMPAYEIEAARESGNMNELFKKYEEVTARNPDNYKIIYNYAVEMYQEAYKPEKEKRPANSAELIEKARQKLQVVLEKDPAFAPAHMVMGQIYYNQGVDLNNENKAIRPEAGKKLTPDQLKKKDDLRRQVLEQFEKAIPYFSEVDGMLSKQGKLKGEEKESLKNSLDLLITIYEEKRNQTEQRRNKADLAKNKAEVAQLEKELKDIDQKITDYTDKYNNVDKVH